MLPLEKQVTSLEISKRLKELKVPQESLFDWVEKYDMCFGGPCKANGKFYLSHRIAIDEHYPSQCQWFSAFTVAELGEMLPKYLIGRRETNEMFYPTVFKTKPRLVYGCRYGEGLPKVTAKTEADARGRMLIYLIENNLIKKEG